MPGIFKMYRLGFLLIRSIEKPCHSGRGGVKKKAQHLGRCLGWGVKYGTLDMEYAVHRIGLQLRLPSERTCPSAPLCRTAP